MLYLRKALTISIPFYYLFPIYQESLIWGRVTDLQKGKQGKLHSTNVILRGLSIVKHKIKDIFSLSS